MEPLPGRAAHEPPPPDPRDVVDQLVRRTFVPYEARRDGAVLTYFIDPPKEGFDDAFRALLAELKPKGFLPILRREGGEHVLRVVPAPPPARPRLVVNVALYLATWVTTTLAGAWTWFVYRNADFCVECFGTQASGLAFSREALLSLIHI